MKISIERKINALLQKTVENGATKEEAFNSLKKANELMKNYSIEISDLKNPFAADKCVLEKLDLIKVGYDTTIFFYNLGKLFDEKFFIIKNKLVFLVLKMM